MKRKMTMIAISLLVVVSPIIAVAQNCPALNLFKDFAAACGEVGSSQMCMNIGNEGSATEVATLSGDSTASISSLADGRWGIGISRSSKDVMVAFLGGLNWIDLSERTIRVEYLTGAVKNNIASVYASPAADSAEVVRLSVNYPLTVKGKNKDGKWFAVRFLSPVDASEVTGWIEAAAVRLQGKAYNLLTAQDDGTASAKPVYFEPLDTIKLGANGEPGCGPVGLLLVNNNAEKKQGRIRVNGVNITFGNVVFIQPSIVGLKVATINGPASVKVLDNEIVKLTKNTSVDVPMKLGVELKDVVAIGPASAPVEFDPKPLAGYVKVFRPS